jgi:hypothetical protein
MSDQPESTEVTSVSASGVNSWTTGTGPAQESDTPDSDVKPPTPKVPKKGVYVLEEGDTPGRVSIRLYGRSHRAVELARLNPNSMWEPGDQINLP